MQHRDATQMQWIFWIPNIPGWKVDRTTPQSWSKKNLQVKVSWLMDKIHLHNEKPNACRIWRNWVEHKWTSPSGVAYIQNLENTLRPCPKQKPKGFNTIYRFGSDFSMKGELILTLVFLLDWGEVQSSQGWRFYHVHCTTQCLSADAQWGMEKCYVLSWKKLAFCRWTFAPEN